ncbi:NAD(P)(+) transhydrogenase, partial [Francisella tularensis subsp. holarctica]|nr:NAD(P)(+) transhydrogenase [Francisella tularensis subsp. holarctica]
PGKHNTIRYFLNTTFNYPTMAEAYSIAGIDGLNKLKPKNKQFVTEYQ